MRKILGLAYLRMNNGLTQFELAVIVGVRQSHISDLECFDRRISDELKRKISKKMGWSAEEICKTVSLTNEEFINLKRSKR